MEKAQEGAGTHPPECGRLVLTPANAGALARGGEGSNLRRLCDGHQQGSFDSERRRGTA